MTTETMRKQMVDCIDGLIQFHQPQHSIPEIRKYVDTLFSIRSALTEQQALPINEVPKGMNWAVSYSDVSYVSYVGKSDAPFYYLDTAKCSVADTAAEALHAAIAKAKNDS